MQNNTDIKISNLFQTQDMISVLIEISRNYLSEKDLASLTKNTLISSDIIFKNNGEVHILESKYTPVYQDLLNKKTIHEFRLQKILKSQPLDFLFIFDLFSKFNNLELLLDNIAPKIKSNGLFAFTYDKVYTRYVSGKNEHYFERSKNLANVSYSHFDGYVQKLLLNNFYIQYEYEFLIDTHENIEVVLIVAQKKNQ